MNTATSSTKTLVAIAGGMAALLLIVSLAPAGETRSRFRNPAPAPAADPTRIEIDRNAGAIRFYVEGREVAFIDAEGINR